jgi:cell division protein ZapD
MNMLPTLTVFEYPLNEKMRLWLRLESILQHLFNHTPLVGHSQLLFFLQMLSSLLDILERHDSRSELLKTLEIQQQKLSQWANLPGVDMPRLSQLQQQLTSCRGELLAASRLGQALREDPLLSAVRQRLITPGNGYSFDLPMLHCWLHQPPEGHQHQVTAWLATLQPLQRALKLYMSLLRQTVPFRQQQATQGFYKNKTEVGILLRLQLERQQNLYPQISAHKNCFAISFFPAPGNTEKIPEQLSFGLACC